MHRALKGSQNPCLSTACTSGLCFSNTTDRNTKLSVPLARLARHSCQDDSHTWLLCTQAHRGQSQSTHILLPAQDSHPAPLAWGAHPGPSAAPVSHPARILLGAGAQGWHRCSGALFAIPCEPSWGFHGSTGTPRHHFHRNSQQSSWHCLHGGGSGCPLLVPPPSASSAPRWHRWLEWGLSGTAPPCLIPEGVLGGPAGSGSSQEPTSCCISRDGCRTSITVSLCPGLRD